MNIEDSNDKNTRALLELAEEVIEYNEEYDRVNESIDEFTEVFHHTEQQTKIIEFFQKFPAILFTLISFIGAAFVFLSKAENYAVNIMYCRYWNIDSKLIKSSSSESAVYILARYILFCIAVLLVSVILQREIYKYWLYKTAYSLIEKEISTNEYLTNENQHLLTKYEQIRKEISKLNVNIPNEDALKEVKNRKKILEDRWHEIQKEKEDNKREIKKNRRHIILSLFIVYILYFILLYAYFAVSTSDTSICTILISDVIVTAIMSFTVYNATCAKTKKRIDEEINNNSNAELIKEDFVSNMEHQIINEIKLHISRSFKDALDDRILISAFLNLCFQVIIFLFADLVISSVSVGNISQFYITDYNNNKYCIIYENDNVCCLKPIEINDDKITVFVDYSMITSKPIEYKTIYNKKIVRMSDKGKTDLESELENTTESETI